MAALTCRLRSHSRPPPSCLSEAQRQWRFYRMTLIRFKTNQTISPLFDCLHVLRLQTLLWQSASATPATVISSCSFFKERDCLVLVLQWVRGCVADTFVWLSSLYSNTNSYLSCVVHTLFAWIKQNWFQLYHISFIKWSPLKQLPFFFFSDFYLKLFIW